jgi:hypothetical protein
MQGSQLAITAEGSVCPSMKVPVRLADRNGKFQGFFFRCQDPEFS